MRGTAGGWRYGRWRRSLAAVVLMGLLGLGAPAAAQLGGSDSEEPAAFTADEVTYDDALGIVTARGNVEITQGRRILLADTVTYNLKNEVVTASGNVSLLEPSGEVLFAEYAELTDDLAEGFIRGLRVLMIGATLLLHLEDG